MQARTCLTIVVFILAATPAQAEPPSPVGSMEVRLTTAGFRLASAAAGLCPERVNTLGLHIHDPSQYPAAARSSDQLPFGEDTSPAVLAVATGGPAGLADIRPGDRIHAIAGKPPTPGPKQRTPSYARVAAILDQIDAALAGGSVDLEIIREGQPHRFRVQGVAACPSRFEISTERRLKAHADGQYITISHGLFNHVADDHELAAVLAHELSHNILRHRERVGKSLSQRDAEIEADQLSIYLMDQAGYDPGAAPRFWRRFGKQDIFGFLRISAHRGARARAKLLETEISRLEAAKAERTIALPDFLTEERKQGRDTPLDRDSSPSSSKQ